MLTYETNRTADDLISLFVFFIVKGRVPNIRSELAFIQDLIDESFELGEAAFCLSALEVAIGSINTMACKFKTPGN